MGSYLCKRLGALDRKVAPAGFLVPREPPYLLFEAQNDNDGKNH